MGTDQNIDFLKETGATVINQDILEFCPEAAKKRQQDKLAILRFAIGLQKAGKKITQAAIAKGLNISQGWVSKLFDGAKSLSWTEFRKLFQSLLNANKGSGIFSSELEKNPVIRNWLEVDPIGCMKELIEVINNEGWDVFKHYLIEVCPHEALEILSTLTLFMPQGEEIFQEFLPPPE